MKSAVAATLMITLLALTGCAGVYRAPFMPPGGETINATGFPVQLEYHDDALGDRTGTARSHSILGLVAWGNSTPFAAARQGGIDVIQHIDAGFFGILNVYSCYETKVTGTASESLQAVTSQAADQLRAAKEKAAEGLQAAGRVVSTKPR